MGNLGFRIAQRTAQIPRFQTGNASIPAPVFGWNARDNLGDMDPRFALQMENYFPDGSTVKLRSGTEDWSTGFPGFVETLFNSVNRMTTKLIAFSGGNSYDASAQGAVGAPLATGFALNRWTGVNAGASGGETTLFANGSDAAQSYDGTTWAAAGLTGPSKLNGLALVNKRVWGYEEGTGQAWYWPPEAVTGAGASFDIGSVVPTGGYLVAIGNLTVDGGLGLNDLTVFVMKSGKIVIYAGTDPADAANWALRGVWDGGNPIGNRCLVPFGNDLVLISDAGFISLLGFTQQLGRIESAPLSDNIRNAVNDASRDFEGNAGWQGLYNPHLRQLIFNIPTIENNKSEQYVMNSFTGAWCKFTNWPAFCWAEREQSTFFGTNTKVSRANSTGRDFGDSIAGRWQSAWNYFGSRGVEKQFDQYRPNIRSNIQISQNSAIGTDFRDPKVPSPSITAGTAGAKWNVDKWNVGKWGGQNVVTNDWLGAGAEGQNASIVYQTISQDADIEFLATDFIYQFGGNI